MIPINKIVTLITEIYPKIESYVIKGGMTKEEAESIVEDHCALNNLFSQKSWLERHWLTLIMILLFLIITINYLIIPIINIYHPIQVIPIPSELWTFVEIIIPTTLGFRSVDKHAPFIIEKIGNKQKSE